MEQKKKLCKNTLFLLFSDTRARFSYGRISLKTEKCMYIFCRYLFDFGKYEKRKIHNSNNHNNG